MKISDIKVTKKKRYAIFADGEFLFSATDLALTMSHIKIGDEVTVQQLEELRSESDFMLCKEYALHLLEYKNYTAKMLCDKLMRYTDMDSAEAATQRMIDIGLVNDHEYAMVCARDLFNIKGYSQRKISIELKHRGISQWDIEDALEQFDEDMADDKLYAIIEKKYMRYLGTEKGKTKTVNALVRLGYSYSDIRNALDRIYEENEIDCEDAQE